MRREKPDLYEKSIDLERTINEKRKKLGKDEVFLSNFKVPLDQVDSVPQMNLFEDDACESGYCMV